MGCNTSKDSFQPAVDEAKEDSVKNGDISKAAEDGAARADSDKEKDTEDEKEKEAAATKIQAVFRGHCARKSLKQPSDKGEPDTEETEVSTKEQLVKEFPVNDKATKIQATFRGHMSRKEQAASAAAKSAMNMVGSAAAKIEEKMQDAVHELEGIDLADPDLHKAATKIQASFRGHKVRQEVSMHCTADESKK
ncbi:neuromodulin isoform X2 [Odontomachus brunneus]|uniref:neuromodulin isoform X2 n=1 Tax=Odontomachus brunneus TaxID=486640 RepID=UPI0013F27860|nr:neuromodulin isoform X2 [Odontomachus brunneus]